MTNTHEGQDSIPREMERDGEKKETEFSNTKLNYKETERPGDHRAHCVKTIIIRWVQYNKL